MKRLGQADAYDFNRRLIGELGFIRKHLRYPVNRRTALPIILILAGLPGFLFIAWLMLFNRPNSSRSTAAFIPVLFCCMLLPAVVAAVRFLRTLRFKAVAARPDQASNMILLERFLKSQQFAFTRHPEAPEVFSILSTPIRSLRDEREIVIFIADPGRILVNSHFTQNNVRSAVGNVHYPELARKLERWLREQSQEGSTSIIRS